MTPRDSEIDWDFLKSQTVNFSMEELFEQAWLADISNPAANEASRIALRALAAEVPELTQRLLQIDSSSSEKLVISLTGDKVFEHSALATKVADFLKRSSKTLNEISKSSGGLNRLTDRILVTAPMPGSVKFVISVNKDQARPGNLPLVPVLSIQEQAIRKLVSLWLQAEDLDSDVFIATINTLNGKAKKSLRGLTKSMSTSGWEVSGELFDRTGEVVPISISNHGISRILDATKNSSVVPELINIVGFVDGWVWSKQVMKFKERNGRAFDAYVPESLAQDVAEWNARHEVSVRATFDMFTTYLVGDSEFSKKSYTLLSINPIPVQDQLGDS